MVDIFRSSILIVRLTTSVARPYGPGRLGGRLRWRAGSHAGMAV